jgi:hypothetical protein
MLTQPDRSDDVGVIGSRPEAATPNQQYKPMLHPKRYVLRFFDSTRMNDTKFNSIKSLA